MYDVFYISQIDKNLNQAWKEFKSKHPVAKYAVSFQDAQKKSLTKFFWIVWDDLIVEDNFKFDYKPDAWSNEYIHVFLNNVSFDGICLVPKNAIVNKREIQHRFFVNKKEIDIVASKPKPYDVFEIDSYEEYVSALENSTTEMFWMSSRNITAKIPNLHFPHDNAYDRTQNHAFIHQVGDQQLYNGVFLCSKHKPLTKKEINHRHPVDRKEWDIIASTSKPYDVFEIDSYEEYLAALETSTTEMFWAKLRPMNIKDESVFDLYFTHDNTYDRTQNHAFLHDINGDTKYDGLHLFSKHKPVSKKEINHKFIVDRKEWDIIASTSKPYDIVFISYQETNADENYTKLLVKCPTAKRVHGVKGIHQAHIAAAKLCNTDMFWIVDGDAVLVDDFDFDYQVARWDKETVHVWRSQNPVNGLVYGYGGVKLFPKNLTINMDVSKPDMTTSISSKFKAIPEISNITAFNTDPYNTWKSAFRECVKLSSKIIDRQKDDETQHRLQTWCSVGVNSPYGTYSIDGAKHGALYGARHQNNKEALKMINNFDWLEEQFNARNI
jgi:hypothetical protein